MNPRELLIETTPFIAPARALEALTTEEAERRLSPAHSIAEIVAHLAFWQDWFRGRCEGGRVPMAAAAALGWVAPPPDAWPRVRARFLEGLAELGGRADVDRPIEPPLEFPPIAHYTVGDALVHVANHNAHHLGQVVLLRQLMGRWPPPSGSWTW